MALILEWSIDTLCHFTTRRRRKKMRKDIVYSTKPRTDGSMGAGESVTYTVEEVNKKGFNKLNVSGNFLKIPVALKAVLNS